MINSIFTKIPNKSNDSYDIKYRAAHGYAASLVDDLIHINMSKQELQHRIDSLLQLTTEAKYSKCKQS